MQQPLRTWIPIEVSGSPVYVRAVMGALIAWGSKDSSCWPTHSLYDEQQNAFLPFISAPELSQLRF